MAAPVRSLCCSVWRLSCRQLSSTCTLQGGQSWRKEHGLPRSGSEYGPLTDLPDWSFADGRPAPPMKGVLRRRQEREALSRRILMLDAEVDQGMESWRRRQDQAQRTEEQRRAALLKPKGRLLMKKKTTTK